MKDIKEKLKAILSILSLLSFYFKLHKGEYSQFLLVFVMSLIMTGLCSLCGAQPLTKAVLSASAGILAMMGLDKVENMIGMKLCNSQKPAILAIIIEEWLVLLF